MSTPEIILKEVFGYDEFRPKQKEIIDHILDKRDGLVLMPTGGGKSICFQIPGLMFEGLTLVISPLISLMKDQVEALTSNGIAAAYYNSSLSSKEEADVRFLVESKSLKFLYVSPERLIGGGIPWLKDSDVSFVAIDEAHCVSMWGHDFRPEYTQLKLIRERWSHCPFVAFTATADKVTRKDIVEQLGLRSPKTFVSSFDRKNLSLKVRPQMTQKEKLKEIISFINRRPHQAGIIYCLSRKETEALAANLAAAGIDAEAYHAGFSSDVRSKVQEDFINDRTQVICATIAFGMGIDKSNVRWVMHYNMPKNIEGYYQEIGRAGRDGLPSDTVLYFSMKDIVMLSKFIEDSGQKELNKTKLDRMLQYAEATTCRRRVLLSYFGEYMKEDCGNCDICEHPPVSFDGTQLAQMALSAAVRTKEKVSTVMLINILRGSANSEVLAHEYHKIKTYGVGKMVSFREWKHYIVQILNQGLFELAYDEGFSLKVTKAAKEVLLGQKAIQLTKVPEEVPQDEIKAAKKRPSKAISENDVLFEKLRSLRKQIASKAKVPPYQVFNDATLRDMVQIKPTNFERFLDVSGVGEFKANKYAHDFLAEIAGYLKTKKKPSDTFYKTLELFQKGLSPKQIAIDRDLQVTTIYSHLASLYIDGRLQTLEGLVEEDSIKLVRSVMPKIEDKTKLRPYFEALNEQVPYHEIRLALAYLEKTGELEVVQ